MKHADLTESQRKTLANIERDVAYPAVRFQTGESLRKFGLVVRETVYAAKRVYADKDGEHLQFDRPADRPVVWHEWAITPAGRRALQESDNDR